MTFKNDHLPTAADGHGQGRTSAAIDPTCQKSFRVLSILDAFICRQNPFLGGITIRQSVVIVDFFIYLFPEFIPSSSKLVLLQCCELALLRHHPHFKPRCGSRQASAMHLRSCLKFRLIRRLSGLSQANHTSPSKLLFSFHVLYGNPISPCRRLWGPSASEALNTTAKMGVFRAVSAIIVAHNDHHAGVICSPTMMV